MGIFDSRNFFMGNFASRNFFVGNFGTRNFLWEFLDSGIFSGKLSRLNNFSPDN